MATITLLNANLWLLPPPGAADNNKRLDKFIKLAAKLDADVINLQEVWLKQYVTKIKRSLPEYKLVTPKSLIFNKSGLVTLLKYKPTESKFHQFKIKEGYDTVERIASKGILKSKFIKDGKEYIILNTHVHDTRDKSKLKIGLDQCTKVFKWAKEHNPTIVSGDFNVSPDILKDFLSDFKVGDDLSKETYSIKNKYAHKGLEYFRNKEGVRWTHPDFVFTNIKSNKAKITTDIITSPQISDHYPMFSEITVPDGMRIKKTIKKSGRKFLRIFRKH